MAVFMMRQRIRFRWDRFVFGAGVGLFLSALLFTIANKLTTAANAIVLQYTAPVFILILSAILFGQRMHRIEVTVVGMTMGGMVLFFFDQLSPGNVLGNILGILAGLFLALMFVMVGHGGDDDPTRMSGILAAHAMTAVVGTPLGIRWTFGLKEGVQEMLGIGGMIGSSDTTAVYLGSDLTVEGSKTVL